MCSAVNHGLYTTEKNYGHHRPNLMGMREAWGVWIILKTWFTSKNFPRTPTPSAHQPPLKSAYHIFTQDSHLEKQTRAAIFADGFELIRKYSITWVQGDVGVGEGSFHFKSVFRATVVCNTDSPTGLDLLRNCSLFNVRKPRSPLALNRERSFLRVKSEVFLSEQIIYPHIFVDGNCHQPDHCNLCGSN